LPEPNNRRSGTQDGVVLAVRDHLHALLAKAATPFPCHYACFIHPRRRAGEQGFGVITLAGESLPLTVTLLDALSEVPTLLDGTTVVSLTPADDEDKDAPAEKGEGWREMLPIGRFMLWSARGATDRLHAFFDQRGEVVKAGSEGPQYTLLCADRPDGWPG
jgi:hypothetical protein